MQLPEDFIRETRQLMGLERFSRYMEAFDEEAPVSIRLNPQKRGEWREVRGEKIPWCLEGYYLEGRPQFTFDPLFHAGCYYVQEAASMFITHILRNICHLPSDISPLSVLDMCKDLFFTSPSPRWP